MKRFEDDGIWFEVDEDEWSAFEKWDSTRVYRAGLEKLDGSSAVDFVGVRNGHLYMVEAKAYTGTPDQPFAHAIAHAKAQLAELPGKVGRKVRDTIAGLVAAYRSSADGSDATWLPACVSSLLDSKRDVTVVVWILEPPARPGVPLAKQKTNRKVRDDRIRAALAWFSPRVFVVDPTREPCRTGLRVARLSTSSSA